MTTPTQNPNMFQGLPRRPGFGAAARLAVVALLAAAFVVDLEQPVRPTVVLDEAVVSLSQNAVQARRGPVGHDGRLASLTRPASVQPAPVHRAAGCDAAR